MHRPTFRPAPEPTRRRLLVAGGSAAWLAACGGGDTSTPAIHAFSADRSSYFVGEQAQVRVRYSGASARIEPDIGPVADGALLTTEPLGATRRLQLVVQTPGLPDARRDLWLEVYFRDRWQALPPFTAAHHAAVLAGDGSVVVLGGSRGLGVLSDAIDRYDPATRSFRRIGTLATGRSHHSAVRLPDGRILVVGGQTGAPGAPFAELVDEHSGAVQHGGLLNAPRSRHTATLLGGSRVLVTGGLGRDSAELWEPATGRWRLLSARMAHDRAHATATELPDGRVLIVGGDTSASTYVFAELFDPRTETFTPLSTGIQERRLLHAAHGLSDGSVLLLGGEVVDGATIRPLASVLRFDPATQTFAPQTPLAVARTLAASARLPGDGVLLVGGETPGHAASASAALWRTGGQSTPAPLPRGRVGHTVHRLRDGRVLVLGGEDSTGAYTSDPWLYE
ncbi:Kelch repeat-containing protein [Rubrivivax sp. RP6-9]|uniref:Kelch repeat-containing protein n=1 Tax=Rubrivivax sp. RP6-9 TaxID=3415750 RepID=UPI003CC6D8F9